MSIKIKERIMEIYKKTRSGGMRWGNELGRSYGRRRGQTRVPTKSIAVQSVSSGYRGEMRRDEVGGRKKETEDIGICG